MVKASSCSSSSSAGGNLRAQPAQQALQRQPPSSNGGCATSSGAIGGPNGGLVPEEYSETLRHVVLYPLPRDLASIKDYSCELQQYQEQK